VKRVLQKMRPLAASIQALILVLVLTVAASQVAGQVGTGQTVIQNATELQQRWQRVMRIFGATHLRAASAVT
jgi:hypothetical protein